MKLMTALVALALLPCSVSAQHWSADEQSLIDSMLHCWESVRIDPSTAEVASRCRPAEGASYWWTPETTPNLFVSPWTEGVWEAWNLRLLSQDLRPIRVQIEGDYGFIYFHGIRLYEAPDGSRQTESWKGMEVWRRMDDGWGYFAGMGSPDALHGMN